MNMLSKATIINVRCYVCIYLFIYSNYAKEEHPASDVREEISYHYRMKSNLETILPSFIVIGPFYVLTDNIKNFLITKRADICKALLGRSYLPLTSISNSITINFRHVRCKNEEERRSNFRRVREYYIKTV